MIKGTTFFLALATMIFFSCEAQESNDTTNESMEKSDTTANTASSEQEITDPEETEIWEPVPEKVNVNDQGMPDDAIVLFGGDNLDKWESATDEGGPAEWTINGDGSMTVKNQSGNIKTKQKFGDVQLHVEWKNPAEARGESQSRGNSGIYLQERYEIQVLDSYDNPTYVNGQAGSVYKQHAPLVNATNPSGEWQTYDIIYHAPEFNDAGEKTKSATLTLLHNGVLVQDHVEIKGGTQYIGHPTNEPHGKGSILLQDHGDNSGVSYRNIWVREL